MQMFAVLWGDVAGSRIVMLCCTLWFIFTNRKCIWTVIHLESAVLPNYCCSIIIEHDFRDNHQKLGSCVIRPPFKIHYHRLEYVFFTPSVWTSFQPYCGISLCCNYRIGFGISEGSTAVIGIFWRVAFWINREFALRPVGMAERMSGSIRVWRVDSDWLTIRLASRHVIEDWMKTFEEDRGC